MKNLSDIEIIESVKRGNQSDYSIIVNRYKNKAFSLLKRMLKNEMEAEEVLQDCFLKAYRGLNNFRLESKFSTWFYRIVYNSALTKLTAKKRKIENEMSSIDDHLDLAGEVEADQVEKLETEKFVNRLIEKLPEKYASLITMFYLEEMSCEEIGEVMNLSVPNVKVILHRSRNALKDAVLKIKNSEELVWMK
ncbi:MAG: sigma-70 family RNA polymerase sigma factor [Ignavibacteriales bacterium]|nr:MAG: sigma-70 family RNA polymerase sigma factor [Ignavibacteriales bacterium]